MEGLLKSRTLGDLVSCGFAGWSGASSGTPVRRPNLVWMLVAVSWPWGSWFSLRMVFDYADSRGSGAALADGSFMTVTGFLGRSSTVS
jgi:hypothetical protein